MAYEQGGPPWTGSPLKCFGKHGIFEESSFICVLTEIFGHFEPFGVDNNRFLNVECVGSNGVMLTQKVQKA